MNENKKRSLKLAWPIFVEVLLFMLMGNVDVVMLGNYSDNAVAAVGNANQIFNIVGFFLITVTASTGVIAAQLMGAGKLERIDVLAALSLSGALTLSLALSSVIIFLSGPLLALLNTPPELLEMTTQYMRIVGGLLFVHALSMTISSVIKSLGYTKPTMYVAMGTNILNIIGNYCSLFGPFGFPVLGLKGVAYSTALSRVVGFIILFIYLGRKLDVHVRLGSLMPFPKEMAKKLLKVGLPLAAEPMSWQLSQVVIFSFINTLGVVVISTKVYLTTVTWFKYLAALAVAQSAQIMSGQLTGADRQDEAREIGFFNFKVGLALTILVWGAVYLLKDQVFGIFTENPEIIALGGSVLLVDVFLEMGRTSNLILINAMKGAGDVRFAVVVGVFSMWLVAALGSYVLGISLGLGLVGIWMANAADEMIRGTIMIFRWKGTRWMGKKLV